MKRYLIAITTIILLITSVVIADAHHKPKHKKGGPAMEQASSKEKGKEKKKEKKNIMRMRQLNAFIASVHAQEKYVMIREGKGSNKKVNAGAAVIVKVGKEGAVTATLSDLTVNEKAYFILKHETEKKGEYHALVIVQATTTPLADFSPPMVQFTTNAASGLENIASPNLQVQLSKASTKEVKVAYTVTGTATGNGTDYTLTQGELTIPAGQTSSVIPLAILDDTAAEVEETIIFTLNTATNAQLGASKIFTYTIQDNDQPKVQFAAASSSGPESTALVNLQVMLSSAALKEVKVNYTVSGTASGGGADYTLVNGTIAIPVGQLSINIPALVIDDAAFEGDETLVVTLSNPVEAVLGTTTIHTYTIQDNDQPRIQFSAASLSGGENIASMNIPVSLSVLSPKEAKVSYTVSGTATGGGTDFTLANGTIAIPPGQTAANISFTVVEDTIDEVDETIIITLSNPIDTVLGSTTVHTYTILDNDQPTVQFVATASNGPEATTPVNLAVSLSSVGVKPATLSYTVSGTATGGGVDYTLANGTLTIPVGQTTANIVLIVVNDAIAEAAETVIVTISNPVDATLGAKNVHTYTINNDD